MKTAIVYYSMNGNTAYTAARIAKDTCLDLIEIKPVTQYPDKGIKKFLWGGKSALMAETPALEPYTFNADNYDQVVIGFPVWAANIAPPVRTFLKENKKSLSRMEIAAFACQSGNGAEKAFRKLRDCLDGKELKATLVLIDPARKKKKENDEAIEDFRRKLSL